MLTKVQAIDLSKGGVRMVAVAPRVMMTEIERRVWGGVARRDMVARETAGRFAETDNVVEVFSFVCAPGAPAINGFLVPVEGGFGGH